MEQWQQPIKELNVGHSNQKFKTYFEKDHLGNKFSIEGFRNDNIT